MEGGQWRDVHGDHHPSINHVHACMQRISKHSKDFKSISNAQACKYRHANAVRFQQDGYIQVYGQFMNIWKVAHACRSSN